MSWKMRDAGWNARLEGGPFDGDTCEPMRRIGDEPPLRVFVGPCKNCGNVHWYASRRSGTETYKRGEMDEAKMKVKYVYSGIGGGDGIDTHETVPLPGELVETPPLVTA